MDAREEELIQIRGIRGRADKVDLSFRHVIQLVGIALWTCLMAPWDCMKAPWDCMKAPRDCMKAPRDCMKILCECGKAVWECIKPLWECIKPLWKCMKAGWKCMKAQWEEEHENTQTQESTEKENETPEAKLATVLEGTLEGLKKLDHFLEAVEKLAVTSLHVIMKKNLLEGISLKHVPGVITAARQICPLLLEFKRDASVFFLPKLQNLEVFSDQLDKYIKTTCKICVKLEKRY